MRYQTLFYLVSSYGSATAAAPLPLGLGFQKVNILVYRQFRQFVAFTISFSKVSEFPYINIRINKTVIY